MSLTHIQKQVIDLLKSSEKILIMPSAPVDGDSIGSALALYIVLKKLGKEATVVCAERVPNALSFLPTIHVIGDRIMANTDFIVTLDCRKTKMENIKTEVIDDKVNIIITPKNGRFSSEDLMFNYGPERYDLIVTVDTAGVEQLGVLYKDHVDMFHSIPVINIDHHISNEQFGRVNYVDVMSSSTCEILIPIVEGLSAETDKQLMDDDIATLLLAGIITDTGSFQNANTTPQAFANAAHLVGYGARQQEIIQHIYKTKELSTLKLWGRILSKIRTDEKYRIVWSVVSQKDFEETGAEEDETGGIVDELLTNAPGAEIIFLLKERKDGLVTGSMRTVSPSIDASQIAEMFGGGGHQQAAGFRITNVTGIDKTEQMVVEKVREYQTKRLGIVEE